MHHYLHLLIIFHFLAAFSSYAMKNEKKPNIIAKLSYKTTNIAKPHSAGFINDNHVLIASIYKSCIVDINTKESKDIQDAQCDKLIIHPHGKKVAFLKQAILLENCRIKIYDTEKEIFEWESAHNPIFSIFNPFAHTIFMYHKIGSRDDFKWRLKEYSYAAYNNNNNTNEIIFNYDVLHKDILINPTQPIVCIADYSKTLSFYNLNNLSLLIKQIILPQHYYHFCYSPNGSYLAALNSYGIYILRPQQDNTTYSCIERKTKDNFCHVQFHPNNHIITTLSKVFGKQKYYLDFWDIASQKVIGTMPFSNKENDFTFAPDGTKIMVRSDNTCTIYAVPFYIRKYNDIPYFIFALHEIGEEHGLPRDVTNYCKNILLNICKR